MVEIILGLLCLAALGLITVQVSKQFTGPVTMSATVSVADAEAVQASPTILAAQPAVLSTRTNNTSGTLTMTNTVHGITTGQRVDLYWTGGQIYGAVVGTVAGTSVPIASVSAGTNPTNPALPAGATAINVGIPVLTLFSVTGNNIQGLFVTGPAAGLAVFNTSAVGSGTDSFAAYVIAAGVYDYETANGGTNPLAAATILSVWMSANSTASSVTSMTALAITH